MKKIIKALAALVLLAALLLGEFHVITNNIEAYHADGYVYVEIMGTTYKY
jgi:hypothetical protein